MGRTERRRRSRKRDSSRSFRSLGRDDLFIGFTRWMMANEWSPDCKLLPSWFSGSGRGLMALEPIAAGRTIVKIPSGLLITVGTVSRSEIGRLFHETEILFTTQQVLATFLVHEKHLGCDSFWHSYISLLPTDFDSPLFCGEELVHFPPFITKKVDSTKLKLDTLYDDLAKVLTDRCCQHCDMPYLNIFTKDNFTWAWFIVNSRAVYMSPSHNTGHNIKLSDDNCLAMAPYLDFLNHSDDAKVQAYLVEDDGSYCLRTLVPYSKYDQVFIHYGSHSNLKLFLEYGFVLPQNKNDIVPVDLDDILCAISTVLKYKAECSSFKYKILLAHSMLNGLYCNAEGLSWKVRVVIFVLLCPDTLDPKSMYRKIFSDSFSTTEMENISSVGKELVNNKHSQITDQLCTLENVLHILPECPRKNTVLLGIELMKTLSRVLDNCRMSLEL